MDSRVLVVRLSIQLQLGSTFTVCKPLSVGQSISLRHPKTWKFTRRWVGPYKIQDKSGTNYKIRSKEGKDIVADHNNFINSRLALLVLKKGETFYPVPESGKVVFLPGGIGLEILSLISRLIPLRGRWCNDPIY